MATAGKKIDLYNSEEGLKIKELLQLMAKDKTYYTESSYSANVNKYPNNRRTFVDKHMDYLSAHPTMNPDQYISNLKLVTRIRVVAH